MEPDWECRAREYPNWASGMIKLKSAQFYCNYTFVHMSHISHVSLFFHVLRLNLCTSDAFTLGVLGLRVWHTPLLLTLWSQSIFLSSADFEANHMHVSRSSWCYIPFSSTHFPQQRVVYHASFSCSEGPNLQICFEKLYVMGAVYPIIDRIYANLKLKDCKHPRILICSSLSLWKIWIFSRGLLGICTLW